MDSSSKLYGDPTEECQSSESGWTMYIGSPMDDDDDDEGGVYDSRKKGTSKYKDKDEDEDNDTDDSMASDASSGPSHLHLQQPWDAQENERDNHDKHKSLSKKNKKGSGKKKSGYDQESRKKDDGNYVNDKKGVISTLQSGNRAWFLGRRK